VRAFAHALQRSRGEHVSSELHHVGERRIGADHEESLSQLAEDRADALDIVGYPGREQVDAAPMSEIRIPEDGERDVTLPLLAVPLGQAARQCGADGAGGDMDCAATEYRDDLVRHG
jgi:hypothetical protein